MRPWGWLLPLLALCSISLRVAATPEDAVFAYDIFRDKPDCTTVARRVESLALRDTVILSAEQGPDLVLDWATGEATLLCALEALQRGGHSVKLLVLQDPSFVGREAEAVRRITRVTRFAAEHAGLITSTILDVEPYADDRWDCAGHDQRARIAGAFRQLVDRLRRESRPLPLEIVVPWWFGVDDEFSDLSLASLGQVTDGIYLMLYGDEGGPVVNGDVERATARMDLVLQASRLSVPLHIALATYENESPASLDRELAELRTRYNGTPWFGGTAVFHAGGAFNAPLVRMLSGSIVNPQGEGLAGVLVRALDLGVETNVCGHFAMRGLNTARVTVSASKAGYQIGRVDVLLARPGTVSEAPPITLRPSSGRGHAW